MYGDSSCFRLCISVIHYVEKAIRNIEKDLQCLCVVDVVFNHTAADSEVFIPFLHSFKPLLSFIIIYFLIPFRGGGGR